MLFSLPAFQFLGDPIQLRAPRGDVNGFFGHPAGRAPT
jgi:hypothetical protein